MTTFIVIESSMHRLAFNIGDKTVHVTNADDAFRALTNPQHRVPLACGRQILPGAVGKSYEEGDPICPGCQPELDKLIRIRHVVR
jgi:hypothetical protein